MSVRLVEEVVGVAVEWRRFLEAVKVVEVAVEVTVEVAVRLEADGGT